MDGVTSLNSFGLSSSDMVQLEREIAAAFNRVSFENLSNTPDFILAQVAVAAAVEFSRAVNRREAWYSNSPADTEGDEKGDKR